MHFYKNICIFGVGGVGGYFGGKIARKAKEENVYFIARGLHLEMIRKNGLVLNTSEEQGMVCTPAMVTDNIADIPSPDVCLLSVKSYDLDSAVLSLKQKVRDDTVIIPLLNGIDICERIRHNLNKGILLPACVYVGTHIEKPGVVTQRGGDGVLLCGRDPSHPDFDNKLIIDFFNRMGIKCVWNDDPYPAIWEKYIFISGFGLVTAYCGKTLGEVAHDQKLFQLTQDIMIEIETIARIRGIRLPDSIVNDSLEKAHKFPPDTKTSFQRDIETKGKRNEADLFGGTIIRLGEIYNIPTPVTQMIYDTIQENIRR